jgi:hypothetical protein
VDFCEVARNVSALSANPSGGGGPSPGPQTLSLTGDQLSLSDSNSVTLPDASSTNEIQTLTYTTATNQLSISSGNTVTLPTKLTLSGTTLSLGNTGTASVNLAGINPSSIHTYPTFSFSSNASPYTIATRTMTAPITATYYVRGCTRGNPGTSWNFQIQVTPGPTNSPQSLQIISNAYMCIDLTFAGTASTTYTIKLVTSCPSCSSGSFEAISVFMMAMTNVLPST